jgi:hypothetical protein
MAFDSGPVRPSSCPLPSEILRTVISHVRLPHRPPMGLFPREYTKY